MEQITEHIRARRSVRTYDGRELDAETREQLLTFMKGIRNPYDIPVAFRLMRAKENGLTCPVVVGTDLYVGGKIKEVPHACAAFGYSFEMLVLYAQSLGVGTVWLGGTMNRPAYEAAMELAEDEMMPCASPLGYPAKKLSLREGMMRKAIKADERLPFEELFYDGAWGAPLTQEAAGKLSVPLEMVRLAPSAVNKQPWRVIVTDNAVHFYLRRNKGLGHEGKLDIQMVDMGIALCHFALAAEAQGLSVRFQLEDPQLVSETGVEYAATYVV